ncbi:MAG: hypothetical protein WAN48_11480 [Actinomycetes bacterium]
MSDINPGDVVRVSTSPGFKNAAGALADPTTVSLLWRVAGGTTTTWVYGVDSQIVKDSVGLFHADIPVLAAGLHYFRWIGTGSVMAAEESTFFVQTVFP